jgi:prepilin-type N-terminal cleavage/methylation domain-containing protein
VLRSLRVRSGRGRFNAGDDGFSLIEVIVALGLLVLVMLTTAGFFVNSLKTSSGQAQQQEAAELANQQLEYTRSVPAKALLYGRTLANVITATTAPAPGITDLSQDVITSGSGGAPYNYDGWDGTSSGQASQVVPLSQTQTVSGAVYTIKTFIDRCYVNFGANQQCVRIPVNNSDGSAPSWLYRISVNVSWQLAGGRTCATASTACQFVASTLRDPGTDPCFNVNVDFAGCSTSQPVITTVAPGTVTTKTSTSVIVTGVNFDPGAKVTIDSGVGTVSNVVVLSTTQISFTLTTNNTPAAVGTKSIRVTNLNGKYALGTMVVNTSALNANTMTPTSVNTGTTTTMVISGSGFQTGGTTISIPSTAGTIVGTPTVAATTITFSFTAATTAGAVGTQTVTVTNPDGATDTVTFAIAKAPVTLTSVSPATIVSGATKVFTLTGSGFVNGAAVTVDAAGVNEVWNSSTSMTVTLTTDLTVGSHPFIVTNPDGAASVSKSVTVTAGPNITAETPDPTTSVTKTFTVTGTNFNTGIVATVTGATVQTTTRVSATQLTVTLTSASTLTQGIHTLRVTNTDGGTDTDDFTVVTPAITDVNPDTAKKNTSTTFTITGTNFLGTTPTVILTGGITSTATVTAFTATSVTFKFTTPTTVKSYSVGVQVKLSDTTVSNTYAWTLAVTN